MSAHRIRVELTGPQVDALIAAAADADSYDDDDDRVIPGRRARQGPRDRAVAALIAARDGTTPRGRT